MPDKPIMIGSFITAETVHHNKVSGHVTTILTNTLVIVDKHNNKHLVVLRNLIKQGLFINADQIVTNKQQENTFRQKKSTSDRQREKQLLIKKIKILANTLNRTPFAKEFPHHSIATHRFGRWTKFLDAAKLKPSRQYDSNSERNIYTNEELLNQFNLLTEDLGRLPQVREFKHYRITLNRFDSWNNFLEAAKATPTKKYNKISNEQFIEDIQLLAKQLNKIPVFRDYPKIKVATDRFGSWNKFLEIAGIKKENQKE